MSKILFMILFIVALYVFAFRKQIQKKCLSYFLNINADETSEDSEFYEYNKDTVDSVETPVFSTVVGNFEQIQKNTQADLKNEKNGMEIERYFSNSEDCDVTYRKTAILQGESAIFLTEKTIPSNDESSNESQKYQATSMQDIFPTDRA